MSGSGSFVGITRSIEAAGGSNHDRLALAAIKLDDCFGLEEQQEPATVPNNDDWDSIDQERYQRLLFFAARKLKRLRWRGQRSGQVPGGIEPEDIVHTAIEKTKSEERIWRSTEISLLQHLMGVISSHINHLAMSYENRMIRCDDKIDSSMTSSEEDPEAKAVRESEEQRFLSFLEEKNTALRKLAELILYNAVTDPSSLAQKLNLLPRSFESLQRALRRATTEWSRDHREQ
jgi:hypothetical protein